MASCTEHKLPAADENDQRIKLVQRAQWLRAAILGANDGLLSTTSLMLGVGAAQEDRWSMVLSGLAGALAGACSMAVGEFVSVSTQRDIEKATAGQCSSKIELPGQPFHHEVKLDITTGPTNIKETMWGETNLAMSDVLTRSRNTLCRILTCEPTEKMSPAMILEPKLPQVFSPGRSPMMKVIAEDANTNVMKLRSPVMQKDVKPNTINLQEDQEAEELPNPYKAAAASSLAFLGGSFVPLASAIFVTQNLIRIVLIAVVTSISLALFGGFGAYLGGSPVRVSAVRVLLGGWIAMAITYGLLKPFDGHHGGSNDTD